MVRQNARGSASQGEPGNRDRQGAPGEGAVFTERVAGYEMRIVRAEDTAEAPERWNRRSEALAAWLLGGNTGDGSPGLGVVLDSSEDVCPWWAASIWGISLACGRNAVSLILESAQ